MGTKIPQAMTWAKTKQTKLNFSLQEGGKEKDVHSGNNREQARLF